MTSDAMLADPLHARKRLLAWFGREGRKLPWRSVRDPYAVVVSEFMLQQTTVATVTPRFAEWMQIFPEVFQLAAASEGQVLKAWQGLGYYTRARNLHRAAKVVASEFGGQFPKSLEGLRKLPGFGPYTAAAVMAFAFDRPVPVLDANIERVMCRLIDCRTPLRSPSTRRVLVEALEQLLPAQRGGRRIISALMDHGALVCRSRKPLCDTCCLRDVCRAKEPELLPVKAPRTPPTQRGEWRCLFSTDGHLALVQSQGPHWKGLWLLPPAEQSDVVAYSETYAITRFRVSLRVVVADGPPKGATLFNLSDLPAMPSPHARAVAAITKQLHIKEE